MKKGILALMITLTCLLGMTACGSDSGLETIEWEEAILKEYIPEPQSDIIEEISNDDKWLSINVKKISEDECYEYLTWCEDEYAFNVEVEKYETSLFAYNQEGYYLTVIYLEDDKTLSIDLQSPEFLDEFNNTSEENKTDEFVLDYEDAESFEKALNNGEKMQGKVVRFEVYEYKPDSKFGVNCWAGEHLNFISKNELDVVASDIIVGRVTEEPSEILGSWIIDYEVLAINGNVVEDNSDVKVEEENTSEITVTMSEEDFKGMTYKEAEEKLREMGFSSFEYETLESSDLEHPDDVVGAVEIKNWEFGTGDFEMGDTFESDAIVVLWYYVCDEPVPNLTADNCADLKALLLLKDPDDPSVDKFASKYYGQVIEFDGCVTAMQNHDNYDTRWDVLIGAGDFDENKMRGPNFRLTDVNFYDMNVSGGDSIRVGMNIHVIASVDEYNANTGLFEIDIISIEIR